jgi:hypothetical protein
MSIGKAISEDQCLFDQDCRKIPDGLFPHGYRLKTRIYSYAAYEARTEASCLF